MLLFLIHETVLVLFEYIRMEYKLLCAKYFAFLLAEKICFDGRPVGSVNSDHEHRKDEYCISQKITLENSKKFCALIKELTIEGFYFRCVFFIGCFRVIG